MNATSDTPMGTSMSNAANAPANAPADAVPMFIGGGHKISATNNWLEVNDPTTQEIIGHVPVATDDEIASAIEIGKQAFAKWSKTPVSQRARVMLKYQEILKREQRSIAELLSRDTGKTMEDAMGELWRGIEVVEHAAAAPTLMMGETVGDIAPGIDGYSIVEPLGVGLGITPFNFPGMIPLWMFPMATVCGNTFILKPSEQDPFVPIRLAELFLEAGAPEGVLQVVHGQADQVNALIDHPEIKYVSFVGSTPVGRAVYQRAALADTRASCMCGAKNHLVVMPDANKQRVLDALVGASVGAAGQRCMAISVALFVGESAQWLPELAEAMRKVKPGLASEEGAAYGPQISQAAKERVMRLIAEGKNAGATCLVDGSDFVHPTAPQGNWVGPTLFSDVTTDMSIYREEVFGPVLACMQVETLEDALRITNDANPYGNGTSIFTNSGTAARRFRSEVKAGNVGINVPIPVPLPFFSFTGWRASFFGDLHAYGKQAVRFYTETRTVTERWFASDASAGVNTSITMK